MTITDKQITAGGQGGSSSQEHGAGVGIMAEQMKQEAAGKTIPAGYKQTEVGVIPEDWSTPTINEITNNIIDYRGRTPKKLGMEWGGGNILALSAGNVKKGFIDYRAECYFGSDELYRKWMTSGHAQKDDIVFTMEAPLGNAALIPDEKRYILSQRTVLLQIAKSKINPKFIIQYFLSDLFQKYISDCATGSTAQGIKRATFEQMFVAVPLRLEEQTAIANVLSDSDALIDALEQLIAKKQAIKSATMQQLLTGRTRLPAFALRPDGTKKGYKPSELGEIPEDWEVVSLGNLLAYEQPTKYLVSHSKFLDEGSYPVLTAGKSLVLGYTNEENGVFTDLPVIIFDDFTTDSKFVDFPFKAKSSAMKMLKPRNQKIPLSLIYNLLNSVDYLVGDHKRHWIGEFQFLNVVMPSDNEEQTAIATILSDMDNELQALTQKLDKARALKQGMMQQLLTGKIRLPLTAGA